MKIRLLMFVCHSCSVCTAYVNTLVMYRVCAEVCKYIPCSNCFERRDAIQVSERRSVSSFRKIGDKMPALGSDRTGVLFNLFPDSKERWGSLAHPEYQDVQSSFKASALLYALSFNPFNFHQTRGLVHNSGSS